MQQSPFGNIDPSLGLVKFQCAQDTGTIMRKATDAFDGAKPLHHLEAVEKVAKDNGGRIEFGWLSDMRDWGAKPEARDVRRAKAVIEALQERRDAACNF